MGAWGTKSFDNDSALDWVGSEVENPIADAIARTLRRFLGQKVRPILVSVVDPAKRKEFDAWKTAERKKRRGGPRRRWISYPRWTPAGRKAWRKKWDSFHRIVRLPGRLRGHSEAEAAAALLDRLTPYARSWYRIFRSKSRGLRNVVHGRWGKVTSKTLGARQRMKESPVNIHLGCYAEEKGLYTLAVRAVQAILDDKCWLSSWILPEDKRADLKELLGALRLKARNEQTKEEKRRIWARFRRRKYRCGRSHPRRRAYFRRRA